MCGRDNTSALMQQLSPFLPENEVAYQEWRAARLAHYPLAVEELLVRVVNPGALSHAEHAALLERCRKYNMAFYDCGDAAAADKAIPVAIGRQLGLQQLDGHLCTDEENISALRVMPTGTVQEGYIPYSNRPINWHTDGYYNRPEQRIRAMLLHCVSDAASGGDNEVLDAEIAYILMRDENPGYIRAFMQPDVMTIPANVVEGEEIRPEQSGPVFYIDEETGALYMRYTARARNAIWKQDEATQAAVAFMQDLFLRGSDYIFRVHMRPGQGLVCNNVLHNRTGFIDDPAAGRQRLIYRARYYDRIQGT